MKAFIGITSESFDMPSSDISTAAIKNQCSSTARATVQ